MIPVQQFPISTFEQSNPGLVRMKYMSDMAQGLMQNIQQGMYLRNYPATLDEQLKQMRANTSILGAQAQYAGPMEQAKVATQQAMPGLYKAQSGLYGAEASKDYASIPGLRAEGQLKQWAAQNPMTSMPGQAGQIGALLYLQQHPELMNQTQGGPAQGAGVQQGMPQYAQPSQMPASPFGQAQPSQLGGMVGMTSANAPGMSMAPSPMQTLGGALNGQLPGVSMAPQMPPQAVQQQSMPQMPLQPVLGQQLGGAPQQGQPANLADMLKQGMFADLALKQARTGYYNNPAVQLGRVLNSPVMESLIASNPGVAQDVSNAMASAAQLSGAPGSQQAPSTNQGDYKQLQQNLSDVLQRRTRTAQMMNQAQYGSILNNLFSAGDEVMPSVSKYAGLAGKAAKNIDSVKSSLGETSTDYSNYLYFTRTLAPVVSNEMRRTLGGQATDNEQHLMADLSNPTYWDSNPKQAMAQWNYLTNMYKTRIDPALAARPADTIAKLQNGAQASSSTEQTQTLGQANAAAKYTQENLEYTAKRKGISVEEVKRRLGVQ